MGLRVRLLGFACLAGVASLGGAASCGAFEVASQVETPAVDAGDDASAAPASDAGAEGGPMDGAAARCPNDMVFVPAAGGPFCIDRVEVSGGQFRSIGQTLGADASDGTSECGWKRDYTLPAFVDRDRPVRVDWCAARRYCEAIGKRLCGRIGGGPTSPDSANIPSEDEWLFACSRGGTRRFSYGDAFLAGACNVADAGKLDEPSGSRPTCEGGFEGLFDMTGNLWEWSATCQRESDAGPRATECLARGPSYAAAGTQGSCAQLFRFRRDDTPDVGIRCCSDAR